MSIDNVKDEIIKELIELKFKKIEALDGYPKYENIYQGVLEDVEINYCLNKQGDKDILEIIAYDIEHRIGCKIYQNYTDMIMNLKYNDYTIKGDIFSINNRIIQSINKSKEAK